MTGVDSDCLPGHATGLVPALYQEEHKPWSQVSIIWGLYRGFIAFQNVSYLSPLNFILLWLFGSVWSLSLSSFVLL